MTKITFTDFITTFQEHDNRLGDYARFWLRNRDKLPQTFTNDDDIIEQLLKRGLDNMIINDIITIHKAYKNLYYFFKQKSRDA